MKTALTLIFLLLLTVLMLIININYNVNTRMQELESTVKYYEKQLKIADSLQAINEKRWIQFNSYIKR